MLEAGKSGTWEINGMPANPYVIHTLPNGIELPNGGIVIGAPNLEVEHEALIYECSGTPLDNYCQFLMQAEARPALTFDPAFVNLDSPFRVPQQLPGGLERWRYDLLTIDDPEAELERCGHLAPVEVSPEYLRDHIPDICGSRVPIVRENVRALLEKLDPGGSYFFPATVVMEVSRRPVRGSWSHWLPRRRFKCGRDGPTLVDRHVAPTLTGKLRLDHLKWEIVRNEAFRSFISTIPVWGLSASFPYVMFNRATFGALKAAGVSGLVERTNTDPVEYTKFENVGYVE
jgi:hypothetical protein